MSDETTQSAEPDLMALAAQADAATPENAPSTDPKETVQADVKASIDTKAEKAEAPEDSATEQKPDETEKEAAPTESKFKKAQKDQARLADNWKKLDQEKAQLRAEREAIAREREEHRRHQETQQRKQDPNSATPEDYEALAQSYEAKGSDQLAIAARMKARELRQAQSQQASARAPQEEWRTPEFQSKWQENVNQLMQQDPSLADEKNPVVGITNRLISDPQYSRFFRANPDGIKAAHEVANIIHGMATVTTQNKGLQQELAKLKAENQRLTKLTAIGGSAPAAGNPATAKKAGDLSDDDIMRMAASADAQGG